MSIRNPKVTALQNEIAERQASLRAILLTERDAAKALLAETEEALSDLASGAPVPAAAVKRDLGRPGSRPAVRAALARFGTMCKRDVALAARISQGAASGALFRLITDGEVMRDLKPGRKKDAVYTLVGKP